MGKLKAIQPRLKPIGSRLKPAMTREESEQQRYRERERSQHWRKWYHSTEWKKLRLRVLVRDLFTCQMCKRIEPNTSKLVGDHKQQHHGDRAMFFNEANVWCICKPCHDGEKQRMERRARPFGL